MLAALVRRAALGAGVHLARANLHTLPFRRLAQELRRRGVGLVLDVGAHDGGFGRALYGAGYGGRMISFEPLPDAFDRLKQCVSSRSGWSVAPRLALSDNDGEAVFNRAANGASSSLLPMGTLHLQAAPETACVESFTVETARLDHLADELGIDRPMFLKMDVQGGEGLVLDGAIATLSRWGVGVQLELSLRPLYDGQPLWRDLDRRLSGLGFELWDMVPGFRDPGTGELLQYDGVYFRR